jgi:hypothetical protein
MLAAWTGLSRRRVRTTRIYSIPQAVALFKTGLFRGCGSERNPKQAKKGIAFCHALMNNLLQQ